MSVRVMATIFDCDIRPCSYKLTLLAYADHADDEGGGIFPSVKRIAKKVGIGERHVQRIRERFEHAGIMVATGVTDRGIVIYRIDLEALARYEGQGGVSFESGGDSQSTGGVLPESGGGDSIESPESSLTISEPSQRDEQKNPEKAPAGKKISPAGSTYSAEERAQIEDGRVFAQELLERDRAKKHGRDKGAGGAGGRSAADYRVSLAHSVDRAMLAGGVDLARFPENLRALVDVFCQRWHFTPPKHKQTLGFWIDGARALADACGEFDPPALLGEYADTYYAEIARTGDVPFTINSPRSLVNVISGFAAQRRAHAQVAVAPLTLDEYGVPVLR